ncbi:hypothetical protein C8R46DRAFT_1346376 [Mycena filopes]|nr:hypothetical protein C8R46DRAFT_1346376 [Mycena filopes]
MAPQDDVERTPSSSLAADRARFAVVRAQILELERSLSFLNEESGLLKDRLNSYTYPVLSLPTEIISEIFVHFLPVYPETPPIIGRSSPNVLGQICRKWREIALSTPALWRAISLPLEQETRLAQKLRLLEISLDHSKSCPLSITVRGGDSEDYQGPFFRVIAAHSGRWEYLRVYAPGYPLLSIETPMPFLRAIYMTEASKFSQPTVDAPASVGFHGAPLLRDVTIVFWGAHCLPRYPWWQLTTLNVHSIPPHDCLEVLNQTTRLVHCYLFVFGLDADVTPPSSCVVTLPHLETFTVHGRFGRPSWRLMDFFSLPALLKLQIEEEFLQEIAPEDDVASLVSRSKCMLQELWVLDAVEPHHLYDLALPRVGSIIFAEAAELYWPFKMTPTEGEEAEEEEEERDDESD